jgi:hypothetical protein
MGRIVKKSKIDASNNEPAPCGWDVAPAAADDEDDDDNWDSPAECFAARPILEATRLSSKADPSTVFRCI